MTGILPVGAKIYCTPVTEFKSSLRYPDHQGQLTQAAAAVNRIRKVLRGKVKFFEAAIALRCSTLIPVVPTSGTMAYVEEQAGMKAGWKQKWLPRKNFISGASGFVHAFVKISQEEKAIEYNEH